MGDRDQNLNIRHLLNDVNLLEEICCFLDHGGVRESKTWRGLHEILLNNGLISKERQEFEQAHYGGGSPGKAFLNCLIIEQKVTIKTFMEKAEKHKRMDIVSKLKEIQREYSITLMSELNNKALKELSNLLDSNIRVIKGWEFFAEDFGYNDEARKSFKNDLVSPNQWSPTAYLLRHLGEKSPTFSLMKLIKILKDICRNDVVKKIERFMEQKKATTNNCFDEYNCTNEPPHYPPGDQVVYPIQDSLPPKDNFSSEIGFQEQNKMREELNERKESEMVQEEEEVNVQEFVFLRSKVPIAGDGPREDYLTNAIITMVIFIILYILHSECNFLAL